MATLQLKLNLRNDDVAGLTAILANINRDGWQLESIRRVEGDWFAIEIAVPDAEAASAETITEYAGTPNDDNGFAEWWNNNINPRPTATRAIDLAGEAYAAGYTAGVWAACEGVDTRYEVAAEYDFAADDRNYDAARERR